MPEPTGFQICTLDLLAASAPAVLTPAALFPVSGSSSIGSTNGRRLGSSPVGTVSGNVARASQRRARPAIYSPRSMVTMHDGVPVVLVIGIDSSSPGKMIAVLTAAVVGVGWTVIVPPVETRPRETTREPASSS